MPIEKSTRSLETECRLCLELRRLEKSHFLPAAMYKYLEPGKNRHFIVNRKNCFSTSRQTTAHLLCRDCEQRFNRNGEQWVMKYGFRGQGKFLLQSLLRSSPPTGKTRSGFYFAGVKLPEIDMDRLCYFGASVFWRASAHRWGDDNHIDLGQTYSEQFRCFLMGKVTFPSKAVIVIHISDADKPMEGAYFPNGGRVLNTEFKKFTFMLPGILFTLVLGEELPSEWRTLCAVQSAERIIFLSSRVQENLVATAIEIMAKNETIRKERFEGIPPPK